jgi:diguanylate cyclase (GGDEF)-like protein/PAS domain S-box-containing protein
MNNDAISVLIIDDSPEDRLAMQRLLLTGSNRRYQFTEADRGEDGLRACLQHKASPPDCILLDYHLPDCDAPQMLSALGGPDAPRSPVVVITGLPDGLDGGAIVRLGAQDFIGKSWMNPQSLTRSLENAIERFAMSRALREKDHMLSESERIAHIGSWIYDLDGNITWSEESYRLWGVSPDTFTPTVESFEALIHAEDRAAMHAWITACLAGDNPGERVFRRLLPDGSLRYLCGRGELKRDAGGKAIQMAGTVQDVTGQKQAERSLEENEERLRLALNAAQMGVFDWDLPSGQIAWTARTGEIYGFREGEFDGTYAAFASRVHPEDLPKLLNKAAPSGEGRTFYRCEHRAIWPDGSLHWVVGRGVVIYGDGGQPLRMRGTAVDITDQKSIEHALKESQERLALAARHHGVGIWDWNLRTLKMVWDDSMYALYRMRQQDFSGAVDAWEKALHPDDRERAGQEVQAALAGQKPFDTEFRVVWPNGEVRHIKAVANVFRDGDGAPVRMLGTNIDITGIKQAEEALRETEALRIASRYTRSLIETSLDPLLTISPEGKISDVNAATEAATGHSRAELIGTDFTGYFDDSMAARRGYLEAFKTGTVRDHALHIRHRDGPLTAVMLNASTFRDDQGKVQGVFAAARDITELKRAGQALRESEKKFSKIFHDSPIGIAISTACDGRFIDANAAFLSLYGYEREEVIGHASAELGLWDNLRQHDYITHKVLQTGLVSNFEVQYHRKSDPTDRTLLASMDTIEVAGVPCIVGFVLDITDRKRAKDYLQESERKFRLSSQRLSHVIWATNVGTWEWNIPTGDVQFNERWAEIIGYTLAELEPASIETWTRLAHPDDLGRSNEVLGRCFSRETDIYEIEARMRHSNGGWIWVLDRGRVVEWSDNGRPLQMSGTRQDITQRKLAELALRESEERLRNQSARLQTLLENASDAIHILDMQGNVVQFSDSFAAMLGYTHAEAAKLSVADFEAVIPSEQQKAIIDRLTHGTTRFESKHRRKDGSLVDVEINAKGVRLEGIPHIYASVRDITRRKALEQELIASKAEVEDLYENAPCGYHSLDKDGIYLRINATELAWLGRSREELVGKRKPVDFYAPASKDLFKTEYPRFMRDGHVENLEIGILDKDGNTRHVSLSATAVRDADGAFLKSRSVYHDITELKKAREALESLMREQQAMLDNELVGIVKLKGRRAVWLNKGMERIFGYGPGELDGQPSRLLFQGDAAYRHLAETAHPVLASRGIYRTQLDMVAKDGNKLWIDASGALLPETDDEFLWMLADISLIKQYQEKIEHIAFHDSLTGLPNRLLIADRLHQALAHSARSGHRLAVCCLDLDGFKPVNDTYGHEAGDRLLVEIAKRLQTCIRANDTAGRLGGDEFVLLLTHLDNTEEFGRALQRVMEAVKQPVAIDKVLQATVSASIGIALFPQNGTDPDTLLRHADQAMYLAKQSGRDRYALFGKDLDAAAEKGAESLGRVAARQQNAAGPA